MSQGKDDDSRSQAPGECEGDDAHLSSLWQLLHAVLPRFLRLSVQRSGISLCDAVNGLKRANAHILMLQVPWMPSFVAVPGYVSISSLCLSTGDEGVSVFPMDVASGVPPVLLMTACGANSNPKKVLDVCCCPGGKLLMMSDYLKADATIVGIDVSQTRMCTTKNLVHKYLNSVYASQDHSDLCPRIFLICADGTTFSASDRGELVYDSRIGLEEIVCNGYKRKRNKSMRGREARRLKSTWQTIAGPAVEKRLGKFDAATTDLDAEQIESCKSEDIEQYVRTEGIFHGYDSVLVDAQCTHDSSYRHLRYVGGADTNSSCDVWTNESRGYKNIESVASDESVYDLQKRLLAKGFASLAPGGELVYSTCSAEKEQNENVVQWLLDKEKGNVELVPVSDAWCSGQYSNDYLASNTNSEFCELIKLLSEGPQSHGALLRFLQRHQHGSVQSTGFSDSIRQLAENVCRYSAAFRAAPGREGDLPGTAYFGMWAGTSGLFLSKIRKVSQIECKIGSPSIGHDSVAT